METDYLEARRLYRFLFFFSSRRRHTRCSRDWSSDVCSSDLCRSDSLDSCSETTLTNDRKSGQVSVRTLMGTTPSQMQLGRRSRTRISHQQLRTMLAAP